jgi:UDP-N-acetylmuramate dehydrogenase
LKVKTLPAGALTTLGVGRKRKVYLPESLEELRTLVKEGLTPIGGGSNAVLAGSSPLISLKNFQKLELCGNRLTAGAGAPLSKILKLQIKKGFSLFEFLAGIPKATVGGLIAQNAGAFGSEVAKFLEEITFITPEGEVEKLRDFSGFGYRSSPFPKAGVVVEAVFRVKRDDSVKEKVEEFVFKRLSKQPPFYLKTAGSTFKNPPGDSAGRLLDACGLKGFKVGGLKFSEKHANFLINEGSGTLEDFYRITETAAQRVKERFGVELHLEVKLL